MMVRPILIAFLMMVGASFGRTNQTIVVSAPSLNNLDLMAVSTAADVTVIDRNTIEQSGAASVPELLETEANILIRSNTGSGQDGQISMRGFGENSHLRTLVLVDGHKMNRPDMGGMGWLEIPPGSIDRIEIIRGGQNVLYGNHAVGGVVKITTKRGGDTGLYANGTAGSFGTLSGGAGYGGAVGDMDYHVGLNSFTSDGYRSNAASRATSVSGSVGWFLNDTDTLTARASYVDTYQQMPDPLSYQQLQDDPTQSNNDGSEYAAVKSGLATLIWEGEREWGAARVSSGLNVRDLDWHQDLTYAKNEMMGISLGPRVRCGSEESFIMGGLDAFYDAVDFNDLHPVKTEYTQARAELDRMTLAPYIFAQRSFEESYILNGGIRYEYARTDNDYQDYVDNQILPTEELWGVGTFPNPNYQNPPDIDPTNSYSGVISKEGWAAEVSLVRELGEGDSVWIGYDRLYRYPTLDEAASYQGFPFSDPLNENLDPETGNNFEIGGRFSSRHWNGSLTTFCLLMDDEISYVELPPIKLNMNIGSTTRLGAETELAYSRAAWGASTRWSFVSARFRGGDNQGNTVPLVPWTHGVVSAWINPADFLRLTATLSYVAEQYQGGDEENAEQKMDDYALVGLRANFQLSENASLLVAVNNLFDTTHATSAYYNGFYPGAGRSFRIGLSFRF